MIKFTEFVEQSSIAFAFLRPISYKEMSESCKSSVKGYKVVSSGTLHVNKLK